jgi:hypothetical protein
MTRSSAVNVLPFSQNQPASKPGDQCTVCMQGSICEARSPDEAAVRSARRAVLLLSLLFAAPAILVVLAGYSVSRGSHPTDEELTARFLSQPLEFEALRQMLDSDRGRLPLGAGPFDLTDLVAAGASTARMGHYEAVLARIGARNFRYSPQSGNLVLPIRTSADSFANSTKSYLYLSRDDPQPLLYRRSYGWRGPGAYWVSGDYRIKGRWFIRHDGTVVVAFAPY